MPLWHDDARRRGGWGLPAITRGVLAALWRHGPGRRFPLEMFANWPSGCCLGAGSSFDLDPRAVDFNGQPSWTRGCDQHAFVDNLESAVYLVFD